MNWYIVKLVFHIEIEAAENNRQFDEQLILVEAKTLDAAFSIARSKGKSEEVLFQNIRKKSVAWKFIDISEIHLLSGLNDGAQIYSSTHESEEANDYIRFVKQKALMLQSEQQVLV